jgi:hypothetical protein
MGIGPLGRRAQEITGFIMRAEKRLDFTTQRGVAGALHRHEFVARDAGGQFNRQDEHGFSTGQRLVHRAGNLAVTVAAKPAGASQKLADFATGHSLTTATFGVPRLRGKSWRAQRSRLKAELQTEMLNLSDPFCPPIPLWISEGP